MAEGFHTLEDEQVLRDLISLAASADDVPKLEDGRTDPAFEDLVAQIVRFATGEDSNWAEPRTLLSRGVAVWEAGTKRKREDTLVSLVHQQADDWRGDRLVLQIVTDDKPFLVDSISAALSEAGKPVSFFINAVINVLRDDKGIRTQSPTEGTACRESLIYAEMDPPIDSAELDFLRTEIDKVLKDVTFAVEDWEPMRARLAACIAQLERARPGNIDREELRESIEFLKWLWDNRFAFLGVRRFNYVDSGNEISFEKDPDADLGILRDGETRVLKSTYNEDGSISPAVVDFMQTGEPVIVAKANARSNVHRRVHMDYIGVKVYAVDGRVVGEERFVGLFTADAYNRPASDIPLVRAKVNRVLESAQFMPGGHNEKALLNILETFPRDEIFQDDIESLKDTSIGILRLYKRPRAKLYYRRDRFDRFISALVFVPRDRFSSSVRESIGDLLARTFDGYVAAFNPYFGDAALVRVHFIIGITPGAPEGPGVHALTQELRALVQNWSDRLFDELRIQNAGALPVALFNKYEKAFDAGYMARTRPNVAILDIDVLESMEERSTDQRVFRGASDPDCSVGIKLYHRGGPISLSNLIPSIENLGLDVIQEAGSDAHPAGSDETIWIHNFYTEERTGRAVEIDAVKGRIEETLCAILSGVTEDDGFNALVTLAGLHWREAWLLRATAKYALQTGFPFSQAYIEEALTAHPQIAASLVSVFHARFNPGGAANADDREAEVKAAEEKVITALEAVESLDEDRIIRRLLNIFAAMTRTNFYQRRADGGYKPMISFKIDSQRLAEIPEPKPYREIFVSGPRVDGVHLRFGPVSRGGLRWSDRREDFRTEVLGLVKAQRVKNAVIVPSGSKGGFYPKHLPTDGDRTAQQDEAREAYKIFISGLLDLTDNIVNGKTVSPPDIVRWDEPDPYLVVAADKGTATFSDTANEISQGYGFWLGDAFASGGSAGYDHKVMGITARGAWEAVKRHFREIGKDIQSEPFTVAGVGDMSGDVFGNGMLLSKQIKLVAAFDHRDIFIDPNPDPATSWEERDRLFKLGRSSWADYNTELISKGGGVFSRRSKSISLSPQAKKLLGLKSAKATPNEVIKAILKLEVELFWLGGIGTYFKSTREENWKVGDRANDSIRIDADEMRMNVIGEGANLGLTQMARIEFARQGGRVNTDAIDNSAGVDSSDHEVNIKILLATAIEKGELKSDDRDGLLKEMTEDVAHYVLRHNYDQTRGISLIERAAPQELDNHQRLIASLENEGRLDRSLEFLPNDKAIATLKASGHGLSRPELSVLVAYAKMKLFDELIDSPAPDDPQLERELFDYFPAQLHVYNHATVKHRLRREIIATRISNDVIDTCGAAFPHRIIEATGARYSDLALAYEAARRVLDLSDFASAVDDLDNQVPAAVQSDLYGTATELLGEYVYQILTNPECALLLEKKGVKALTDLYLAPVKDLRGKTADVLSDSTRNSFDDRLAAWQAEGVPEGLAREAGLMPALSYSLDIVDLARASGWQPHHVAAVFFAIGDRFQIQQARTVARDHLSTDHYDRLAIRRQVGDLTESQTALTRSVIERADAPPSMDASKEDTQWLEAIIEDWWTAFEVPARQTASFVAELDLSSGVSVGKMALFTRKLSDLISRAQLR